MKIVRHLNGSGNSACVATIGNFDGMHLGHQALLQATKQQAALLGVPACVVLFEPHAKEFFSPETAPARLMLLREKLAYLRQADIDQVVCLHFNDNLAQMAAHDFVSKFLFKGLGAQALIVGDDFRFGHKREGDVGLLQALSDSLGITLHTLHRVDHQGIVVSSTAIRTALQEGDLETASLLLGHRFSLSGRVVSGQQLGQRWGFPTANIPLKRNVLPISGVFIARVTGPGFKEWPAAVSVGHRPTVGGGEQLLEAHLLDFEGSLYQKRLDVTLHQYLRPQQAFDSEQALRLQIAQDIMATRDYFNQTTKLQG